MSEASTLTLLQDSRFDLPQLLLLHHNSLSQFLFCPHQLLLQVSHLLLLVCQLLPHLMCRDVKRLDKWIRETVGRKISLILRTMASLKSSFFKDQLGVK